MRDLNEKLKDYIGTEEKKYYPEFHRLFKGLIVEVCEGEGTHEDPCRLVFYVHDENGKFIGKLETHGELAYEK